VAHDSAVSTLQYRLRENATEIVSLLVTGIWLAALFSDQGWWLPFLLFGYIVVVPLTELLFEDESAIAWWNDESDRDDTRDAIDEETALQTLRERYARGELTDQEFEQKLDRLLETETITDLEPIEMPHTEGDQELERE
jgi:uncharacterized membrane protein